MDYPLQYYISCFGRMNCNKRKGETAPHKAVLLLAVIEEVRLGHITNGFVPLNDQMVAAFKREWRRYVGESELFNPVFETPFFHLDYEPFWELMKREPFKVMREYSLPRLRENFFGAKIPDELCDYMADDASCRLLKKALIEKYLPHIDSINAQNIAAETSTSYGSDDSETLTAKLRA